MTMIDRDSGPPTTALVNEGNMSSANTDENEAFSTSQTLVANTEKS